MKMGVCARFVFYFSQTTADRIVALFLIAQFMKSKKKIEFRLHVFHLFVCGPVIVNAIVSITLLNYFYCVM